MINEEKRRVVEHEGNALVTANPGTGKTLLLAYKYIHLIKKGISPDNILCLTFTEKAKREMESRILKVAKKEEVNFDISKLNVYTFHSFALDNIEEEDILSTSLLRYAIFSYLKENEILNYSDEYLLENIVPKMENLMRYLKSFGITPDKINSSEVKVHLEEGKSYSKEEIDKFCDDFLAIYSHYEKIKNRRGVDYADLLIKFLELRETPKFDYVLVDELQDVNVMEADIALKSGNTFVSVGDKKQAIFGFQGGSILNFEKFKNSKKFVLSDNFRSTDEILSYAREYFNSRTKKESHKLELKDLKNAEGKTDAKPAIYDVSRENIYAAACDIAETFSGKTAIITRTNYQIMDLSKELSARGMEYSSTFFSASNDAKNHIIAFLKGLLSSDVQDVKNSMFTPFFPCTLQEAFVIAEDKYVELPQIFEKIPAFKEMREKAKNVEDINILFRDVIIPICISYGKEYLSAAVTIQNSYSEALSVLEKKNMNSLINYLKATDLQAQESDSEKKIMLTTVHKAKGMQFENVIYIPSKTTNRSNFQDKIVEAILKTKNMDVKEELEEETLRINFVAFTRAEKNLVILTDKAQDYLNDFANLKSIEAESAKRLDIEEGKHRAFGLFVNGQMEEAKKLLENNERWIKDFVKNYFDSLEHISFTSLPESAYDYFSGNILNIRDVSYATNLGSEVHEVARKILLGEEYSASKEAEPFIENVKKIIRAIEYDEVVPEMKLEPLLSSLGFDSDLKFKSFIDAVFRKGDEYLIVDWKTDKKTAYASKHRQQLEAYRRVFSAHKGVPLEKIRVAIGYVGLRPTINTGKVDFELDQRQPSKSSFETFSKRVNKLLSWIKEPEEFFKEFIEEEVDDLLWRYVVEEYGKETNKKS